MLKQHTEATQDDLLTLTMGQLKDKIVSDILL